MIRETNEAVFFWHGDSVFSNWHRATFIHNGVKFENSETALMMYKAVLFNDTLAAIDILNSQNPSVVKQIGREVKNYNDKQWTDFRYDYMVAILLDKFNQNPNMKEELLNTGDKEIVEASPVDKIWGIGVSVEDDRVLDRSNWKGQNLLGKALMEVREIIKHK